MSYQTERDQCITAAGRAGLPYHVIADLLRVSTTLQRYAVAECNGDWPCDNGDKGRGIVPCPICESGYVKSTITGSQDLAKGEKGCPSCRATARARRIVEGSGYQVVIQGDPRGYVLRIAPMAATREDLECGRAVGVIGVPVRER